MGDTSHDAMESGDTSSNAKNDSVCGRDDGGSGNSGSGDSGTSGDSGSGDSGSGSGDSGSGSGDSGSGDTRVSGAQVQGDVVTMTMADGTRVPVHKGTTYKYLGIMLDPETSQAAGSTLHIAEAIRISRFMLVTMYKSGASELTIDMGRMIHLCYNQPRLSYGLGIVIPDSQRLPKELIKYELWTMRGLLRVSSSGCPSAVLHSVLGGKFLQRTIQAQQLSLVTRALALPPEHARRVALGSQAELWMCTDIPAGVRKSLHMNSLGPLLECIDTAIAWNDDQRAHNRDTAVGYSGGRTRQWFKTTMSMLCHSGSSPAAVVGTWEEEQMVVAKMTADSKAALYILSIHQHQTKIAKLKSTTDVAWMSSQLVGAPFTATRRETTGNVQRVQVRGGMWSFLPWSTYGALRKYGNKGCMFCNGCDAEGKWTVTHLLTSCMHDELVEMRRSMWQEVVRVVVAAGLAGTYMVAHATDYSDPTMIRLMFALMVGEEVPNSFINLGLESWRARRVARQCGSDGKRTSDGGRSAVELEAGAAGGDVDAAVGNVQVAASARQNLEVAVQVRQVIDQYVMETLVPNTTQMRGGPRTRVLAAPAEVAQQDRSRPRLTNGC